MTNLMTMPKVELHCHLDGSIDPALIAGYLADEGRTVPEEKLLEELQVQGGCENLAEYLAKFTLPLEYVQEPSHLEKCAYELVRSVSEEHVVWLETRFAPGTSLVKGYPEGEIIDSVIRGLKKAEADFGVRSGVLCCAMRHRSLEENLKTLHEARERLGSGVVGFDLAGDEHSFPNGMFSELFAEARRLKMPLTIHAGETGNADSIKAAIEMGASRIGHGIAMWNKPDLIRECVDQGVGVEVCPTSNFQTQATDSWENYPLRCFLDQGVKVSLNTDNRTVSGVTLTDEFELCRSKGALGEDDLQTIYQNSVETSFAPDEVKDDLLKMWKA